MLLVMDSSTIANTRTFGKPSPNIDATHGGKETLLMRAVRCPGEP